MSLSSAVLPGLGLMVFFLLLNAFFVAIEFALIALKRSRVEEMKSQGHRLAQVIDGLHKDIDMSIAGAQLGITLSSLALGWVGEHSIQQLVEMVLAPFPAWAGFTLPMGTGLVVSFIILSVLHVVIGEQVPKSWALRSAEPVTVALVYPFKVFCTVVWPLVKVMNGLSELCLRLLGVPKVNSEDQLVHSAEELRIVIDASGKAGELEPQETSLMKQSLKLKDLSAKQVMLAWARVDVIRHDLSFPDLLAIVAKTKHSRLPVLDASSKKVIGVFHSRELFDWLQANFAQLASGEAMGKFSVAAFTRALYAVKEDTPANILLDEMRAKRLQIAIVENSRREPVGMITLEDLVEELVGDIFDEYDRPWNPQGGLQKPKG